MGSIVSQSSDTKSNISQNVTPNIDIRNNVIKCNENNDYNHESDSDVLYDLCCTHKIEDICIFFGKLEHTYKIIDSFDKIIEKNSIEYYKLCIEILDEYMFSRSKFTTIIYELLKNTIELKKVDFVKFILNSYDKNKYFNDEYDFDELLKLASYHKQSEILEALLNFTNKKNINILFLLECQKGNLEIVKSYVKYGVKYGTTLLTVGIEKATLFNKLDVVDYLEKVIELNNKKNVV